MRDAAGQRGSASTARWRRWAQIWPASSSTCAATAAEQARGWPPRSVKVVLDMGLTAVVRHYGLIAPERPFGERLRHWGDEW